MLSFVFPGQGSQHIGMGKEFFETFQTYKEVIEEIEDSTQKKINQLMLEGTIEELTKTNNAQPALFAVSMGILKTLEKESNKTTKEIASYLAGHSLGEYSALCASGVLSLKDAARLVQKRGDAMQQAAQSNSGESGKMAAILGLDIKAVEEMLEEFNTPESICVVANDNDPGQVVITGHGAAVEKAATKATEIGAKRAVLLNVSAPFHSPLMEPAAKVMQKEFMETKLNTFDVPVIFNLTATPETNPELLLDIMPKQITGRVRWRETVMKKAELGCTRIVEIGSGKVLTGLNKRIDKNLQTFTINTPNDLEDFLKTL